MGTYYDDGTVTLYHGDALDQARNLATGSVQTIVTSPPYFGLRDYGSDGQLGAEPSVGEYVDNLVALFRELRRVLADDGTLWLNLGDSYASGSPSGPQGSTGSRAGRTLTAVGTGSRDVAPKNLLGVPWRVAFALQADGWILRSDVIWAKPNPMPESVTDRPTKAHEYLFLLAKSPRYFYDADAIREESRGEWNSAKGFRLEGQSLRNIEGRIGQRQDADQVGRNKRTVWEVAATPFPGAHFAVYPPELIRPCILAGSRPGDTILDPFSGSGTTGMVATYEGRRYVGIDLNADYLDLSLRTRFAEPTLGIEAV